MKTIFQHNNQLPEAQKHFEISIGEGQTPLVRSHYIGPQLGLKNLFFKLENLNPTGSYKDRFAASFVSTIFEKRISYCVATSSGNTGAALAAYCAAAGIACYIVVVDGAPMQKINQMQLYGGKVVMVSKFGIDTKVTNEVFAILKQAAIAKNISLPISAYCYCAEGMKGVEAIASEILDDLNGDVQHIFSPSGGGGLSLAIAKGVLSYGKSQSQCKVHCVQPSGNNTIAGALRNGLLQATEIKSSSTSVSGLQVPGILDGTDTLLFCKQTGGTGYVVEDKNVFETQSLLARHEGIFCEPAGAVSVSALAKALKNYEINPNDNIACLITGSGFKDMSNAVNQFNLPEIQKNYDLNTLSQFLATL